MPPMRRRAKVLRRQRHKKKNVQKAKFQCNTVACPLSKLPNKVICNIVVMEYVGGGGGGIDARETFLHFLSTSLHKGQTSEKGKGV